MPPRTSAIPSTEPSDILCQPQPQSFLFVSQRGGKHQPRKRKDWKVIRSHVMHHWHRRERDSRLSRLKSDIVRPGEKPTTDKRSKPLRGKRQVVSAKSLDRGYTSSFAGPSAPDNRDEKGSSLPRAMKSHIGGGMKLAKKSVKVLEQDESIMSALNQVQRFKGRGVLDPFDTSAVPLDERAQEMIAHYSRIVIPSMYPCKNPAKRTNAYFQLILTNPLILTAKLALAFTNARYASMSPTYASEDAVPTTSFLNYNDFGTSFLANREWLRYKANAFALVNQALKTEDGENVGNATLQTVITLVAIAHFAGNLEEAVIHMHGVFRILNLRGGLTMIPPYILETLCLADLFISAATNQPPMIPYESINALITLAASTPSGAEFEAAKPPFHPDFLGLLTPDLFSPSIRRVTCDLYKILFLIAAFDDVPFFDHLPLQIFFVGHRLTAAIPSFLKNQGSQIKLKPPDTPDSFSPPSTSPNPLPGISQPLSDFITGLPTRHLQEATRLALLIFINTILIKSNPHTYMLHNLVVRLQDALTNAGVPSDVEIFPPSDRIVLLWILFVGAQGSRGRVEGPWFITLIARFSLILRSEGSDRSSRQLEWTYMRSLMEQFLWLGNAMEQPWKRIWKEVEQVESILAFWE